MMPLTLKKALLLALTALLLAGCTVTDPTVAPTEAPTEAPAPQIKNIVLIIGDGMGVEHIAAGEMTSGTDYAFTEWQYASVNTDSVDENGCAAVLTDSAAAGTALATGVLTINKYVGMDPAGNMLPTILDYAKQTYGKATGIVTTDKLYGATPAAFSAHSISRNSSSILVGSQLTSGVDLLCGTADAECTFRKLEIETNGYRYCSALSQLDEAMEADKTYWQLDLAGADADVALKDVTVKALDFLDRDEDGFLLVVEQAHIDKYAEKNDFASMEMCVNSLNDTVNAVLEWVGGREDTVILITADHATGGLSVSTQPIYPESYRSASGRTVYYNWETGVHTKDNVGLFIWGMEADLDGYPTFGSQHLIKNTDVYLLMKDILDQ